MAVGLEGLRILDWTVGQQGPIAGVMLGDLGADVIKLEDPKGDLGRDMVAGRNPLPQDRTFYFEANNRNKRGIVIDLKSAEGKQVLYKLVAKSDVFVQNFRKGVQARLGVDYETLSKYNPKLIYASATAFGPDGPDSEQPGFDLTGLARSGVMLAIGHPDWPPVYPRAMADQTGGVMLAWSILAALVIRERTGVGQSVDASLMGAMMWACGLNISSFLIQGNEFGRVDRRNAKSALSNYYQAGDGKWFVLAMTRDYKYWHDFCTIMGIPEIEKDPRFADYKLRLKNKRELIAALDAVFATKPRAEWLKRLGSNEDMLFSYVNSIPDLPNDPQVIANKYIVDYEHPVLGKIREVGLPIKFSKTPPSIKRPAPLLGEHTEEILKEVIGYNEKQIAELRQKGVITPTRPPASAAKSAD